MENKIVWVPLVTGLSVLVLTLGVAVVMVSRPTGGAQDIRTQATEASGLLGLSPDSGLYTFSFGQAIPVGVVVDSAGKKLDGADVIVNFDPKMVQVVGAVATTTLFDRTVVNKVDNAKGEVRLGLLTFDPKPVVGVVATFSIRPIAAGKVDLNFSFVGPGATADSNLAESGTAKDILSRVQNASFVFK